MLKEIDKNLKALKIDEGSSKQLNVINEIEADNLIKEFENFHIGNFQTPEVDRIKYQTQINEEDKYNWYPMPSHPNMGFEQRNKYEHKSRFDGESIYVWNINEMPEFQIFDVLSEMLMVACAYETSSLSDHEAAKNIITRFTRAPKLWWEHYLNVAKRGSYQKHATKIKKDKDIYKRCHKSRY